MIDIKFYRNENNHRYAISALGHAGSGPHGQDIVCAAVSTLLQSLGNYIESNQIENNWHLLEQRYDEGNINVEAYACDESLHFVFDMVFESLEDLADMYPNFLKII